ARERVRVTIDGASYNSGGAGGEEIAGSDDILARQQQCEQMYVAKVRQLLSYIPDVMVSVSVDLHVPARPTEAAGRDAASSGGGTVVANAVPVVTAGAGVAGASISPSAPANVQREQADANPVVSTR